MLVSIHYTYKLCEFVNCVFWTFLRANCYHKTECVCIDNIQISTIPRRSSTASYGLATKPNHIGACTNGCLIVLQLNGADCIVVVEIILDTDVFAAREWNDVISARRAGPERRRQSLKVVVCRRYWPHTTAVKLHKDSFIHISILSMYD